MRLWQLCELNRLLAHAYRNCSGHRRKLASAGFEGRLTAIDEIRFLPFFEKDELRARSEDFAAVNFPTSAVKHITSGGTTGTPTRFAVAEKEYDKVFEAWKHSMWKRAGFKPGSRCLDLTWAFEDGTGIRCAGPNFQYLSIHALDSRSSDKWFDLVDAFTPEFILAFPSTASALAKRLMNSKKLRTVKTIILASERFTPEQEMVVHAAFPQARVFQWYGMSELAGFASGCERSDVFHHWPQSGILELVDDQDRPIDMPGETGEIVLTGFFNYATPFIRYRTGDLATLGTPCVHCGRPHIILNSIDGRVGDFLLGTHGRMLPLSALNFHGNEFQQVFAHQFVQEEPGKVTLRYVPLAGFGEADAVTIQRFVGERLGSDFFLNLEPVHSIPRTARGKQSLILRRCNSLQDTVETSLPPN
jgi:phenylacetate-CoA ligase